VRLSLSKMNRAIEFLNFSLRLRALSEKNYFAISSPGSISDHEPT
jgi:hypothetical protein